MSGQMEVLDGYGRVSRVAGRDGDSYGSPREQEERTRAKAEEVGAAFGEFLLEENISGGKAARERGLERLIQRCERGESQGIVVLEFARFSREHPYDVGETLNRLRKAGARLISCLDNFDSSTPWGAQLSSVLAGQAYGKIETARARGATARENAVNRGVWMGAKVPIGYLKDAMTKHLVPDPVTAPLVAELFERRAAGASVTSLMRWLGTMGYPMAKSSIGGILVNEAYLGLTRSGLYRNADAHPALVTRELFDGAQAARGVRPARTGALSGVTMLRSLCRCSTCGSTMLVGWTRGARDEDGEREKIAIYSCQGQSKGGCSKRAHIRADLLDRYVETFVLTVLARDGGPLAEAVAKKEEVEEAARDLADAQHRYQQLLVDTALHKALGTEDYTTMLRSRKDEVGIRRDAYGLAKSKADASAYFEGSMLKSWLFLTPEEKRQILHGILGHIIVRPANGKRGIPVESRVQIVDREGVVQNNRPSDFIYLLKDSTLEPHAEIFVGGGVE